MSRFLIVLATLISICANAVAADSFQALCYHDIVDSVNNKSHPDDIETKQIASHFAWLKENGFNVVSAQDVILAKAGKKTLPEKAVLLTFDDGYQSFYKTVFPLLKAFNYPATLAVVGSWLEKKPGETVLYGNEKVSRDHFVSLDQLREISDSGLVEIASHSYDLHHGVLSNPYGNEMPAAIARVYDKGAKAYESDAAYESRIRKDLERNSAFIARVTGKRPVVMVWPYGRYNGASQEIARSQGMELMMSLDDGENHLGDGIDAVRRHFLLNNPTASEISWTLREHPAEIMRLMHVDIDYIFDKDPVQQEKNLGLLLDRVKSSGVTHVFLQAFSDDDASGVAKSLYFQNRHLPVKADIFSRIAWQISTRTKAKVFAWLPLTAFIPKEGDPLNKEFVTSFDGSKGVGYKRLSSFSPEARKYVTDIYEDLGKYAYFNGLVIHDDAALSDFEDASPSAIAYYKDKLGLPGDIAKIRANPEYKKKWTKAKTEHLSWFAGSLKEATEKYRKPLQLARNYYAEPILNPDAEEWFAQSLEDGLRRFDWVAIMAMPYMEKAESPSEWMRKLVAKVKETPGANKKVVFELQAKNWAKDTNVSNEELLEWMKMLRVEGMLNFGYYPDDPFANHPDISVIRSQLSRKAYVE